jgi:hypothetical protein
LRQANQPVSIQATSSYTLLHDIKRVFNLDWLTVTTNDELANDLVSNNLVGDSGKFYSPYLPVDSITVNGQQRPVGKRNKPCIGLATWNLSFEWSSDNFPYNRLYPKETWANIFQLCLHAGYDIITLNSPDIDFENKAGLVNDLCDCIIGYEGGVAHLGHVLKVPTIILPWRTWCNDQDRANPPGDLKSIPHTLHIDKQTYFLDSADELLAWTPIELKNKIQQLYNNQGNNMFFTGANVRPPWFSSFEREFIQTYIVNPTVGGQL